jgi:hypothetical protein
MTLTMRFVVNWLCVLPVCVHGFGIQHLATSMQSQTSQSLLLQPQHQQRGLFGSPMNSRRQSHYQTRVSRSMKPFWKKSSSSDNEKSSNHEDGDDGKEDEEPVPKLPSEEASTVPTGSEINSVAATTVASASTTTSSPKEEREGILDLINDVGQNFKPLAEKATAKGYQAETQTKKILYAVKACVYYMLFILYRAYRGLFVLVPAVFRQVYRKMELAMNSDLALEDDKEDGNAVADASSTTPEKVSWRTRVTVSILASVVTASYVLGATFKMVTKFGRTVFKSRSIPKSFEAAADELVSYEDRVSRIGKINGDTKMEPGGFAP